LLEAKCGSWVGLPEANRKFFVLASRSLHFLFQHAIQVWCPAAELFRRTGFRISREIETERVALKVLHGDFKDVAE
jgi:hypothetical protein